MAYRATRIDQDPLDYFLSTSERRNSFLHVADVVLRENKDPREIFAHLIRFATASKWSHSAIVYLVSNPYKGFNNTFLVEAITRGVRIASWRNEVVPFERFTVGIKRPCIDWYMETPYEMAHHDPSDPKDTPGIDYLRHVRGIAVDQINSLYNHKTVFELTALYAERAAKRHLKAIPQAALVAAHIANFFKQWDEKDFSAKAVLRFMCSGLVQYSFFEALRRRIINDIDIPAHHDAALNNLSNMHRVIYRDDPEGIITHYIQQVQSGKLDIHAPIPGDVIDLLKTATPADFNNSPNLIWRYVILKGVVWRIDAVPAGYIPQSQDEKEILQLLTPEHSVRINICDVPPH